MRHTPSIDLNMLNQSCGNLFCCCVCKGSTNLQFYQQTPAVVCDKAECIAQVDATWCHEARPLKHRSH